MLILLVYACEIVQPKCGWHMKIGNNKFVDISKFRDFLGNRILRYFPKIHAITGCNTTSLLWDWESQNSEKAKDRRHPTCYVTGNWKVALFGYRRID